MLAKLVIEDQMDNVTADGVTIGWRSQPHAPDPTHGPIDQPTLTVSLESIDEFGPEEGCDHLIRPFIGKRVRITLEVIE